MSLISSDSSHGLADHEQSTLWSPSQLHMPLFGEENWPAEWATDDSSPKSSKSDSSTSSDSLAASEDHEDLARQVARLEAQVQELARSVSLPLLTQRSNTCTENSNMSAKNKLLFKDGTSAKCATSNGMWNSLKTLSPIFKTGVIVSMESCSLW